MMRSTRSMQSFPNKSPKLFSGVNEQNDRELVERRIISSNDKAS